MVFLVALHFLVAATSPVLVRMLDRRAFLVLALVPAASFVWLLGPVARATEGDPTYEHVTWIPQIGLDVDFAVNALSGIVALLVTGVGALVLIYCTWYFRPNDPEIWRFSGVLTGFAGAMLGLVLADNVYVLYVFWELTTVLSFLLIGHNPERRANRRAALNALIVTTFGGLAMLVGLVGLHLASDTPRLSAILADPPAAGPAVTASIALVLVGALSKSALLPFHFWLPGAMAAPTPVSAYLHAAAMVKAGVYLVALLAPVFADTPGWRPVLVGLGIATMILGGLRALRQYDVKLLLAYGTVSQLGFLVAVVGAGTRSAAFAGLALLCAHGLFKSALFLVVGVIDRSVGTRDLRELSGLRAARPGLFVTTVVAAASMAGLPVLFGFTAKEAAFAAFVDLGHDLGHPGWGLAALVGTVVGSILTVAYSARFVWGTFADKKGVEPCTPRDFSPWFAGVPGILAACSLAAGLAGPLLTPRIATYADQFPEGSHEALLTLWHGFTPALWLSVVAVVAGVALYAGRHPVAAAQHAVADRLPLPDAERAYQAVMRGVDRLAVEVTGRTQRGSLPVYLGIILVTLVLVPGSALVRAWQTPDVRIADNPLQVVTGLIMIAAAILTVRSRRRLRAVLLLGVTGYGTSILFVAHGAPDLALTQVLVETFLLVTFVLVLRRLPPFFSDRPFNIARWVRVGVGTATGLAVAGFAFVATNARTATPISAGWAKPAYEYGGGKNIVNVALVDIRAWDTIGELSVLVVAATGIASLIFLLTDRSMRQVRVRRVVSEDSNAWLAANLHDQRRSIVFEIITRLIFHTVVVFSIFLMISGHNSPGGGFAGGLIAGLALMIRYLAGGREELDNAAPVDAGVVLGLGLAVAALSGLLPTLLGGGVLQSAIIDIAIPVLGELHLVTSVFFDIGVYLVVVGLALDVLRSLGSGIDAQMEDEDAAAEDPNREVMT
ncbi:monovalent cation/H+ antiporter subunit A [Aeromicrobium flavum]|uniref:Monovalent cation/H+ antiporter subunit A n=1 Tax=Aeromicrobium flavum TaxID=416568 RepID=A0A512HSS4_9ACTN|nr:Na+/H+ antiporter subunit A [Aeromicrobium flavum]GEO88512.1 monovalent cation/H+ antiporter subunit A [Aeromicrobium flavum]